MSTLSPFAKIESLLARGDLDVAAADCIQLVKQQPDSGDAWLLMSEVSMRLKQRRMAVNSALKAVEIAPENPAYLLHLARLYAGLSAWQATRKVLQKLIIMRSSLAISHVTELADLFYQSGQIAQAINLYQQVLDAEPDNHQVLFNLGALYRYRGELEKAASYLASALALEPKDYQAACALAHTKKHSSPEAVLSGIDSCLTHFANSSTEAKQAKAALHYAKGKVLEDSQQWSEAFDEYAMGAALKKTLQSFTCEQEVERIQAMQKLVKQGYFQAHKSEPGETGPIFVVGMPRTGTTVVERILASHSAVTSGGELNYLPMTLLEAGGASWQGGPEAINSDTLAKAASQDLTLISQRYMALAQDFLATQGPFTDKLPLNALFVPVILSAMPNARVIHVERNAMDTAFSNFKMLFNRGYEYSYSLDDIATYLPAYQAMMNQWQETYAEHILTVSYEQLIATPESICRQLLDFCQLGFEADCLQFHTNAGTTQTASASQVTEPLHNRYVGQWRRFEKPLAALKKTLAERGVSPLTEEDIKW